MAESSTIKAGMAMMMATTVVTTITALFLARKYLYPRRDMVIASPLAEVLAGMKPSAVQKLEYHPDEFPGARDVDTPYGSIRVYEFGPSTGKKVLFIHGISTSCMTLTRLANGLAYPPGSEPGRRVLLFDLFGRGFSSTPSDLPHDSRLYVTQALLALTSSPLAWTGDAAFSLVGYSMGGGVAISLATAFPHLVDSLVLLAPAGLIRPSNFGLSSRLLFQSGWVPPRILEALTKKRLRKPIAGSVTKTAQKNKKGGGEGSTTMDVDAAIVAHVDAQPAVSTTTTATSSKTTTTTTTAKKPDALEDATARYVNWMLDHHQGFVPAFVGCIASAPLTNQHRSWAKLGEQIRSKQPEYFPGRVVVILGREDEIVDAEDYEQDGKPLLIDGDGGDGDKVVWKVVGGGHNFPMTNSDEALSAICEAWGSAAIPCDNKSRDSDDSDIATG